MDFERLITGIMNAISLSDERSFRAAMADHLRGSGWYVCEGADELRQTALAETDPVDRE